jgi:hypothetical protein
MKITKTITDRFGVDNFSPYDIATIMDFINEYTIKYYLRYFDKEPEPHHLANLIYKKNKKLNNVKFELVMNMMEQEGFITCIPTEDDSSVKSLKHTEKGLAKYFSGGFKKDIIRKRREKWLMITGQISILIAGLYYLIEIIRNVINCFIAVHDIFGLDIYI